MKRPTKQQYYELLLDRVHVCSTMFQELVSRNVRKPKKKHRIKELDKKIIETEIILCDLYQEIGQLEFEEENIIEIKV